MGIALFLAGGVMLTAAVRNTQSDLIALVDGDLTGQNNFFQWMLAILVIGIIGYIPKLKPISTALLVLVCVVIFMRKGNGFFSQLASAANATTGVNSTNG
jgi:hypothetical protein